MVTKNSNGHNMFAHIIESLGMTGDTWDELAQLMTGSGLFVWLHHILVVGGILL